MQKGKFSRCFSSDSTRLLVYNNQPFKLLRPIVYDFNVYNDALQLQWQKSVTVPYNYVDFDVLDLEVDSRGTVYVVGRVAVKRDDRTAKHINYRYMVLAYDETSAKPTEYRVDLDSVLITSINLNISPAGELIFNGLYSNRELDYAAGTFHARIDPVTKGLSQKRTDVFDFEKFANNRSKHKKRLNTAAERVPEYPNLCVRDVISRPAGGSIMLIELFNEVSSETQGLTGRALSPRYGYGLILVCSMQPNGEIDWTAHIPKQQVMSYNSDMLGFVYAITQQKIHILFNDHASNYDGKARKAQAGKVANMNKMTVTTLATINEDGSVTYTKVGSMENDGAVPLIKRAVQIDENTLAIIATWKSRARIGTLHLP